MDITETLAPKSDQMDAEDLIGGPRTFTVESVNKGSAEQPVEIRLIEFPRCFRPSKTVRRILAAAWGTDATVWQGRRMTLFRDPTVTFGPDAVGGIRVSRLSHIDKPITIALMAKRGKRQMFTVEPLNDVPMEIRNFLHRITEASLADLDTIAAQLKERNLGPHKVELQKAWAARKAALTTPAADDDAALDAAQEAEVTQ
jgi:hypothetical protein